MHNTQVTTPAICIICSVKKVHTQSRNVLQNITIIVAIFRLTINIGMTMD